MYLKRESNLTEKLCQHYRQGSVQVLHQQVFPEFEPPTPHFICNILCLLFLFYFIDGDKQP